MIQKSFEVDKYIMTLSGEAREWIEFFVNYMRKNHPELEEVISFQMPTYKLGNGKSRNYIAFSPAKNHVSMHTLDFAYIVMLKEKLSCPGIGKGCVNIKYTSKDERQMILDAIEDIVRRKSTNS